MTFTKSINSFNSCTQNKDGFQMLSTQTKNRRKSKILSRIKQSYKSKSDSFTNIRFSDLEKQLIVKLWQYMNDNDPHCTAECMICKHHCLPEATVKVYGIWHSKYSDNDNRYQHGTVCNMCLSGLDDNVMFEQPQRCPICGQICIETLAMVTPPYS